MKTQNPQPLFAVGIIGVMLLVGCSSQTIVSRVEDKSFEPGAGYDYENKNTEAVDPSVMYQEQIWEGQNPFQISFGEQNISESPLALDPADSPVSGPGYAEGYTGYAGYDGYGPYGKMSYRGALTDIYFEFDRYALREEAQAALERNARLLNGKKDWTIMVEGHTDERGTSDYNLVLGERRARVVQQYLKELGVPASKVRIVSYGKEKPFCVEGTEECRQQNRRVHFVQK